MRPPLDRDFLRTEEDLIFCVTGYLHPPDKVTAYLKYIPSPAGKWAEGKKRYARAFPYYSARTIFDTFAFLKTNYPRHISFCPVRNMELCMVPHRFIADYYLPEERARQIVQAQNDALEGDVSDFISFLCDQTGAGEKDFGVTGSVLTRMHNPLFSDMDLLVYGLDASRTVREALREVRHPNLRGMNQEEKERWVASRIAHFPIGRNLAAHYCERRWNFGYFRGRYFSIHPTHTQEEVREAYGERVYRQLGKVRVRARIRDASESMFLPAIYRVAESEVVGREDVAVSDVVSYEGLYCDVAQEGEVVDVCGTLESHGDGFSVVVGTGTGGEEWVRVAGYE